MGKKEKLEDEFSASSQLQFIAPCLLFSPGMCLFWHAGLPDSDNT